MTQTTVATPTAPQGDYPARLVIPSIEVDAEIEMVGVLTNGEMDTPRKNPWTGVGLYNAGPRPGERGSAVIAGHLDRPGGLPAVFWNLRKMHVDDEIRVIMSSGEIKRFRVTRIASYPPKEAPLQDIFGKSDGNYLNLITCAGYWIPEQQQTSLRIVVYSSEVV